MRLIISLATLAIAIGWFFGGSGVTKTARLIPDVSWPNCGLANPPKATKGIVGINGGLAFRANPCLAKQIGWFKYPSVYLNTGYPGASRALKFSNTPQSCLVNDEQCLAYNYGYNSGLYDIEYALMQGVIADRWWLDVETENSWSDNTDINRAALTGLLDAVSKFAGKDRVGFYSYPGQWDLLTSEWRNGYPAWIATGSTQKSAADTACRNPSFTNGPALLGQFVPSLDQNVICD